MSNTAFSELEESTALTELELEEQELKAEPFRIENRRRPKPLAFPKPLFVDCLLEPAGWQSRQRRWTATVSLTVQLLGLGILILIPLMFTEVLPPQQLVTLLIAPPPPPPVVAAAPIKPIIGETVSGRLVAPTKIPDQIKMIKEDEAPPANSVWWAACRVA